MSRASSLDELVARAAALAVGPGRAVLGIAGSPGSGKSTLAAAVAGRLEAGGVAKGRVAHVPMDGFHLADVVLAQRGLLDTKGAPDTFDTGGYVALLRRLRADDASDDVIYAPAFERDIEQPVAGAVPVPRSARLVLTEGNYLLLDDGRWADVAPELDEVWFCDPHPDVRMAQLLARHVAFGKTPARAAAWVQAVDVPNALRVDATRGRADVVVPAAVLRSLVPESRPLS